SSVFSGARRLAPRWATTNVTRQPPGGGIGPDLLVGRVAPRHPAQDRDADEEEDEQRGDRDLVGAAVEQSEHGRDDDSVDDGPNDGAELPDQPVQAEHLAHALWRAEAKEHEAVHHSDPTKPGAEQRAGNEERD